MTGKHRVDNLAESIIRKLIAFVVVMSLAIPLMAPGVFAASAVSITGGESVEGGETFTIGVTFSGGDVGRVDAQMYYDTDYLTYISGGTSAGDTGYIQLKSAGTEGAIVFNIKFQALAEGETELQVTTNEMYDLDEMLMDNPSTSTIINIEGNAEAEEVITEPPEEEPEEPSSLVGVDERLEGSEAGTETETPFNLDDIDIVKVSIIVAAILFVLILIITSLTTRKKRKTNKMIRKRIEEINDENYDSYPEPQRIGRSGKPLDYDPKWEITDDDYKDIDKW